VLRAAEWLAERLRRGPLQVTGARLLPTGKDGPPVVFGESPAPAASADSAPDRPTVLVYGHYDVQPTDPLEQWSADPFVPRVQGDRLYARGASDMKGQILAVLNALEALASVGPLPVGVKYFFEGEEEIGSPHLPAFIRDNARLLTADVCLNPDAGMLGAELPTIVYALRGIAYFELRLHGPTQDLHSGAFGGVVHNPAQVLCELVAAMHDASGRVTLPGFYDSVRPLDAEERQELARLPVDEKVLRALTGVPALWGEEGYTPVERLGARPTLEVNGLLSGFTGQGQKTVLPAAAMAKLSMRLVADQKPAEIRGQLERFLAQHAPKTVRWELDELAASPPVLTSRDSLGVRALAQALEAVWGKRPLVRREGGSVPVAAYLKDLVGVESVLTGFALPDDNAHSPNEHLHLPTWQRGTEALVHFFCNLAGSLAEGA
jgi:acetylornithine deacetylase/succinyl-diaminopimelate desuccinylase-like protein